MKKSGKTAVMVAGLLVAGIATASTWVSYCDDSYCIHCNSNGYCIKCELTSGSCSNMAEQ